MISGGELKQMLVDKAQLTRLVFFYANNCFRILMSDLKNFIVILEVKASNIISSRLNQKRGGS